MFFILHLYFCYVDARNIHVKSKIICTVRSFKLKISPVEEMLPFHPNSYYSATIILYLMVP